MIESNFRATFINKQRLTMGSPKHLRNNDQIAIIDSSLTVFTYFDCFENDQMNYPEEPRRKYMVLHTIGEGAFSEVRLAVSHEKFERRALKKLNKALVKDFKYLESEVKLLKSVKHSCIVQLYDVVESEDYVFLVMLLADGGELPEHRLPEKVGKFLDVLSHMQFKLSLLKKNISVA